MERDFLGWKEMKWLSLSSPFSRLTSQTQWGVIENDYWKGECDSLSKWHHERNAMNRSFQLVLKWPKVQFLGRKRKHVKRDLTAFLSKSVLLRLMNAQIEERRRKCKSFYYSPCHICVSVFISAENGSCKEQESDCISFRLLFISFSKVSPLRSERDRLFPSIPWIWNHHHHPCYLASSLLSQFFEDFLSRVSKVSFDSWLRINACHSVCHFIFA